MTLPWQAMLLLHREIDECILATLIVQGVSIKKGLTQNGIHLSRCKSGSATATAHQYKGRESRNGRYMQNPF